MTESLDTMARDAFAAGRYEEAFELYLRIADFWPGKAASHYNLGCVLQKLGRASAAEASYRCALEIDPAYASAWNNLGNTLVETGDLPDAAECMMRAAEMKGEQAGPSSERRSVILRSTKFPKGAESIPPWRGEDFSGRTLLVFANQGIGDALDWARYLGEARGRGGRLALACQAEIVELLEHSGVADSVVALGSELPASDLVAPMSALKHLIFGDEDPPPVTAPYLSADARRADAWRAEFQKSPELKVGLVWAGNPLNPQDAARSVSFKILAPLLSVGGVKFYGLQFGPAAEEAAAHAGQVTSLIPKIENFADTAAAVCALDLVISVDTAVAHVAGALGRPVWVLVPEVPDPRWRTGPGRPARYANAVVYRRSPQEDWPALIARVGEALRTHAAGVPSPLPSHGAAAANGQVRQWTEDLQLEGFNKLVHGRHGVFLANENDTYIGRALLRYGEYSEAEFKLLADVCDRGHYVVDVGANIGGLTVPIAQRVGPGGRVVAYEPQPVLFRNLCANVALNSLLNVECVNAGLGEATGSVRVPNYDYSREGNFGGLALKSAEVGTDVEVKRLDDCYPYDALDLIKIDVEGMEQAVLEGAAATIERFRPTLYVENDRREKSPGLIKLIQDLGYRLWWHMPPLFNPKNFAGNAENIYPKVVSINMVCVHRSRVGKIAGLKEVTDPGEHGLGPASTSPTPAPRG